jgi:hypothetical protein
MPVSKISKIYLFHVRKVISVLSSIENEEQLYSGKNIIDNFVRYWRFKGVGVKTIRNSLAMFNSIYNFKKRIFQNYD